MTASRRKQDGVVALFLAFCGFVFLSIGDGIVKSMTGEWPGLAVSTLRYVFGAIGLTVAMVWISGVKSLKLPSPTLQFGRGAATALVTVCFFIGVQYLPLATATAIQFTSPMLTAVISVLFLKEKAPAVVWVAMAMAFAGVLVVLRPEVSSVGLTALFPLFAALGLSLLMIMNRKASALGFSVLFMQWTAAVMAVAILIPASLIGHYSGADMYHIPVPDWSIILRCATVAVTGTASHWFIYMATVRASAVVIAPMQYVQLLMAVIIGWLFFDTAPDLATIAGSALIVGGGIYLWNNQRKAGKKDGMVVTPD